MQGRAQPLTCRRKVRHATAAVAREIIQRLAKTHGYLLAMYHCPCCDGFHLTKEPWKAMWRRRG